MLLYKWYITFLKKTDAIVILQSVVNTEMVNFALHQHLPRKHKQKHLPVYIQQIRHSKWVENSKATAKKEVPVATRMQLI